MTDRASAWNFDAVSESIRRYQFDGREYVGEIEGVAVLLRAFLKGYRNRPVLKVVAGEEIVDEGDGTPVVTGDAATISSGYDKVEKMVEDATELFERHDLNEWEADSDA